MPERRKIIAISEEELARRMTPDEVDNLGEFIKMVLAQNTWTVDEAGRFMAQAEPVVESLRGKSEQYSRKLAETRASRRELFQRAGKIGLGIVGLGVPLLGGYSCYDYNWGVTAARRNTEDKFAYDQKLEQKNTLGIEPSVPSYTGWTVRYLRRDISDRLIPTNLASDTLQAGSWIELVGSKINRLDNTGILINNHVRTSDGLPVGKLSICTKYSPPVSASIPEKYEFGEEWVLRDQSTGDINSEVVVFENLGASAIHYLLIVRSRTINSQKPAFQLKEYKLLTK